MCSPCAAPTAYVAAKSYCPAMAEVQVASADGASSVTLPVKMPDVARLHAEPGWVATGPSHVGASCSTEATGRTCEEQSGVSGCTQLTTASDASVAASAGDATVGALRSEIEGLRAELDVLRGLLDEGLQQRHEAERSQNELISRVEQLSSDKLHAEQQMREAQAETQWLRGELSRCQRWGSIQEPEARDSHELEPQPCPASALRNSSWSPPKRQAASSPPSPARCRARAVARNGESQFASGPGSGMSRSSSYKGPTYDSPAPHTDEVDEMWRSVLQRFPQHPHWCLVKEKRCVYRMGSQTGKKIVCRVTHGGLQVRVGGGWMAALPFLDRYGPLNMGHKNGEDPQYNCTNVDLPPSMERLLVPTKSWAQRIGISKTPDLREQRRLLPQDSGHEEEPAQPPEGLQARSMSQKRMAWSAATAPELTSPGQGLADAEKQALQPLPWPGRTRYGQTTESGKL